MNPMISLTIFQIIYWGWVRLGAAVWVLDIWAPDSWEPGLSGARTRRQTIAGFFSFAVYISVCSSLRSR